MNVNFLHKFQVAEDIAFNVAHQIPTNLTDSRVFIL